jgi:hypothetical protein
MSNQRVKQKLQFAFNEEWRTWGDADPIKASHYAVRFLVVGEAGLIDMDDFLGLKPSRLDFCQKEIDGRTFKFYRGEVRGVKADSPESAESYVDNWIGGEVPAVLSRSSAYETITPWEVMVLGLPSEVSTAFAAAEADHFEGVTREYDSDYTIRFVAVIPDDCEPFFAKIAGEAEMEIGKEINGFRIATGFLSGVFSCVDDAEEWADKKLKEAGAVAYSTAAEES